MADEGLDTEAAAQLVEKLKRDAPGQLEVVWDNLNWTSKHRFERMSDSSSDLTLDWMDSLLMKERINVNHMEDDKNKPYKNVALLSIADFIPTSKERVP